MAVGLVGGEGLGVGDAFDAVELLGDEVVGAVFDPLGCGGVGWAAGGWVVFEAAVFGWVVGGGDDDAVAAMELEVGIAGEDGVGEHWGGGVAEVLVDEDFDVVGGEDLESGDEGGLGEGVGVFGEEEGAEGVLGGAVFDDGLGDGGDVVVVKACGEGRASVARGSESYALGWDAGVGVEGVVGGDEAGDIDEVFGERWLAGDVGLEGCDLAHAGICLVELDSVVAARCANYWR